MTVYRIVKCPKCGKYRRTSSLKTVRCFFCGSSFEARKHIISEDKYKKDVNRQVGFK
ncbi:MAG: hypothetical protein M1284_00895 [Candidatus Parvarchaeota archaeon]|jgi:hypothetical protein|nr:hypothetical protein [Candidatus Parvarchaeota archaeon]MCL5420291.1 hypothetical protein [Candidatus Parvarchaeota archaeon]